MKIEIIPFVSLFLQPAFATEVSGNYWIWKFWSTPTMETLEPTFREKVQGFMDAFAAAGESIRITPNSGRNKETQYLAYWSWQIAKEGYRRTTHPKPPEYPTVDIDWFWSDPKPTDFSPEAETHNVPSYVGAATHMVAWYGLARAPKPSCKLVEGTAVRLDIVPRKTIAVRDKNGNHHVIPASASPKNPGLTAVAESYGLYQVTDCDTIPICWQGYWSDNGKWD